MNLLIIILESESCYNINLMSRMVGILTIPPPVCLKLSLIVLYIFFFRLLHGENARYFETEVMPKIKHNKPGLLSMVNCGNNM